MIDEAGMAETRVLAPVLRLVDEAGGKAVLVGDPAQLPAVGAGGLYGALCERLGAVHLVENRRQHDAAERDALARLRSGEAEGYLGHAAREGRLLVSDDPTEAKKRLLADWWRTAAESDLRESVMLAHWRADVRDLNEGARALLQESGRLGEQALVAGERDFRAGDRVVCRRNDPALGVRNGTRASVRAVDPVLGIITLQMDGGPSCQLHARYAAEHLDHGYALTGHAAQGASVERAFVLVRAEGALAEWGYVTASRARTETRLYAVGPELSPDEGLARIDPGPATRHLVGALSRAAAEQAAVERVERKHEGPTPARMARERLEREIESRSRLLASTRKQLAGLGWVGRRRHGDELREVIGAQLRVLADLRTELRELPTHEVHARPASLERPAVSRAREPVVRERPERGIGLEL